MKKARLVVDEGGFAIEASKAEVRVYVYETDEGGIYFDFAAVRGGRFRPIVHDRERRNLTAVVLPAETPEPGDTRPDAADTEAKP